MKDKSLLRKNEIGAALGLVFLSGFVALIYQVLWMKQIGLLFGNTSQAAGATLTSFFAGLAVGSWTLGKHAAKSQNPMRVYAWLEAGIAITALLYFAVLLLFQSIYPAIHQNIGSSGWLLLVKFLLSLLLVFPPAFCMGGTIPVIGQYMIRETNRFGALSSLMYGINTLGAAIGAALAGFYLPLWLGFNMTCGLAILISVVIAIIAYRLSRNASPVVFLAKPNEKPEIKSETSTNSLSRQERRRLEREQQRGQATPDTTPPSSVAKTTNPTSKIILMLCFLSGFGILALEVIWTRLFSLVLENSVYTFAAILLIVLISLAIGALASSLLSRLNTNPLITLTLLMLIGAGAIAATPYIFMSLTNGMQLVTSMGSWSTYILLILKTAALTIAPSAILLGMVFPYLMKAEEYNLKSPGLSLGRLATANTIGAILGALLCGFLLLEWLGMWRSMQLIAWVYIVAALIIPLKFDKKGIATKLICFAALIGVLTLSQSNFPVTSTDPLAAKEKVIEVWEGSDCTVSVTESQFGTAIRINSHYSLGSTGAYMQEKFQTYIPLMIKPDAEDLFFLGVGTGITAGAALDPQHKNVKRVVACELVPEVITAAKKYMTDINGFDATGGLFKDPRATVLVEDGRHHLMATDEKFDIINADLFVPFRSGAGSLYTKEHFQSCKDRLKTDGIFVQWLPLYQLTENEFSIISKTMLDVFGQVSIWRHNFQPGSEIVGLIGHESNAPLPACDIDSSADKLDAVAGKTRFDMQQLNLPLDPQTITLFYCGNLSKAKSLFEDFPVNTDNHPVIEYIAPRTYRSHTDTKNPWFVGEPFSRMVGKILEQCPPDQDPLLERRTPSNRRLPIAGYAYQRARISETNDDSIATETAWQEFIKEWTDQ